jgi:hypothetical protein
VEAAAQVLYFVKLGAVAFAALVAVIAAVVQIRRKRYSSRRRVAFAALPLVLVVVLILVTGVRVGVAWVAGLVVAGAAIGWLLGRGRTASEESGRAVVRRSPVLPVLLAVSNLLVVYTLAFGTTYLLALALLAYAAVAGLNAGSAVGEIGAVTRAGSGSGTAAPAPAEPMSP